jgi:hypothetical protein
MKKEIVKLADKFKLEDRYLTIIERFEKYIFVEVQAGAVKYWNCANVFTDNDGHEFTNEATTDLSDMHRNKEKMKAFFDGQVIIMKAKAEAKVKQVIKDRESAKISDGLCSKVAEAKQMRSEAFRELNQLVCSAKDFKAVQNSKDAKRLIEQIAFIDSYLSIGFSTQFLPEA